MIRYCLAISTIFFVFGLQAQKEGGSYIWQDEEWVWVEETQDGDIVYDEGETYYEETEESNGDWNLTDSLGQQYVMRKFRDKWKSGYKGADFAYKEQKKTEYKPTQDSSKKYDMSGLVFFLVNLAKIIGYSLIVLVVILIIRAIFKDSGIVISGFKKTKPEVEAIESTEVNIEEDWLKKAIEAKKRGELRLSIRYYFLAYLKQLHLEKHIDFHKDKSNREYRYEIVDVKIRSEFDVLSRVFDYCWYGDFEIGEDQFSQVDVLFSNHLKS